MNTPQAPLGMSSEEARAWERGYERAMEDAPQVDLQESVDGPTTCRVRVRGQLIFAGRDFSADLIERGPTASTPPEADVQALAEVLHSAYRTWRSGDVHRHQAEAVLAKGYSLAPEPTDQTREQIAEVLAEHLPVYNHRGFVCGCNCDDPRSESGWQGWCAHVADLLSRVAVHVSPETADEWVPRSLVDQWREHPAIAALDPDGSVIIDVQLVAEFGAARVNQYRERTHAAEEKLERLIQRLESIFLSRRLIGVAEIQAALAEAKA